MLEPRMTRVLSHVKRCLKVGRSPSESGLRVADLLDRWVGLHHIPEKHLAKVDWANPIWQELLWDDGCLSTFDFDMLTRLVFLAHDMAIRVEVNPCMRHLKLMFHPKKRDGQFSARHPTLARAVAAWREAHPMAEIYEDSVKGD